MRPPRAAGGASTVSLAAAESAETVRVCCPKTLARPAALTPTKTSSTALRKYGSISRRYRSTCVLRSRNCGRAAIQAKFGTDGGRSSRFGTVALPNGGRGERSPRPLHWSAHAPVAQGIERCPAEAEVACSNHAGRIVATGYSPAFKAVVRTYDANSRADERRPSVAAWSSDAYTPRDSDSVPVRSRRSVPALGALIASRAGLVPRVAAAASSESVMVTPRKPSSRRSSVRTMTGDHPAPWERSYAS